MPNFNIETSLKKPVIGIDEVGRGPLAGPVVSCACIYLDYLINSSNLSLINDSKKLSASLRNQALKIIYELQSQKKIKYALGFATVKEIDSLNILEATKISMKRAILKLNITKANLIIDGNINLNLPKFSCTNIIKGDQKSITIATASIIAKVHRDRYMKFLSLKYPEYMWNKNAGYGTKEHIAKIFKKGFTEYHRKSFDPIKSLIHKE